ncbi:MAG: shikimate dehydrogenase [Myxococcota bacterium]|nr:shikimate dehydrogenase [Myxococcota bacterium]
MGHPVAHSLSPALHQAAMAATGIPGSYELIDAEASELQGIVDALRSGDWTGLNVTIPHKERVAHLCDSLGDTAEKLGAVNTLTRSDDGAIVGHNTDLTGLLDALEPWSDNAPWKGRPVCVLGAGGAAGAAVVAAAELGAAVIRIWNRTEGRAHGLVERLGVEAQVVSSINEATRGAGLVLQATAMGMGLRPTDPQWARCRDQAEDALRGVADDAVLMDLVYGHDATPWVAAAEARGLRARDGLGMLLGQGARAFWLWTGVTVSADVMRSGLDGPDEG